MPNTQEEHLEYTIREFTGSFFNSVFDHVFKNNDIKIIYDIGANVGAVILCLLKYLEVNNKEFDQIIGFEPDKTNFLFMKNLLKEHKDRNKILLNNFGIFYGKTESEALNIGWIDTKLVDSNVGGYICDEKVAEEIIKIKYQERGIKYFFEKSKPNLNDENGIKTFSLKELENLDIPTPDFVKIDIEGAEKNVLMNSKILQKAKYIIVEFNYPDADNFFSQYLPTFKIIKTNGCDYFLENTQR